MEPSTLRDPEEILKAQVRAGAELVYARNPALAAALDVPPPPARQADESMQVATPEPTAERRGFAYRVARKIYRKLKHVEWLQPILETIRSEVRRRF